MNSFQKTIKYLAIAFAIFLTVIIISAVANAAFAVFSVVSNTVTGESKNAENFTETYSGVSGLNIDNLTGKLIIKTGDVLKVEAENVSDDFEAKVQNGTLTITDNKDDFQFLWFDFNGFDNPNSKITLYLPGDFIATDARISTGAGSLTVDGLHAKRLTIDAGAGSINGNDLSAEQVKVEGGVGSISLKDVLFDNSEFKCGIGSVNIEGKLYGDNEFSCGIGEVDLNLTGNPNDYDFDIDSGVGSIRLNGEKLHDEYSADRNSENSIRVDGGIGDVNINLNE